MKNYWISNRKRKGVLIVDPIGGGIFVKIDFIQSKKHKKTKKRHS